MSIFNYSYDPNLAYQYYLDYQAFTNTEDLNNLLTAVTPLIGYVGRTYFYSIPPFELEFIYSDVLNSLYQVFTEKDNPDFNTPGSFTKYCFTIIKRSIINVIKKEEQQCRCSEGYVDYSNNKLQRNVEDKIYIEQCCFLALKLLENEIRFNGNRKKACMFISECIILGREEGINKAKALFKINKKQFPYLVKYTRMKTKELLNYVKELTRE